MPKKRKKKGLALYQSKTKRRKITKRDLSLKCDSIANNDEDVEVNIISGNDKKSTIAYEMEDNLNYILDQISEISSEMISSITMEYSENEIVNSVLQFLSEQTKEFDTERDDILSDLREYVMNVIQIMMKGNLKQMKKEMTILIVMTIIMRIVLVMYLDNYNMQWI